MDPRVAAILKWTLYLLFGLLVFVAVSNYQKREAKKDAIVATMRGLVSEASFYRSIGEKDARTTFLRGIALLHDAGALGMEPDAVFNRVFERKDGKSSSSEDEFSDYPTREKLARESLTRGYLHAGQLGLLAGPGEIAALKAGDLPNPGVRAAIICVIDPSIAPGLEKVVPNFELRRHDNMNAARNDVEIAAARGLAGDLANSQIIDRETETKIIDSLRPKDP